MWEWFFDAFLDKPKEIIDKINWEKIEYFCDNQKYDLYFLKNWDLIVEDGNTKKIYQLAESSKDTFNESVSIVLNHITGKKYPNRPLIWAEVNRVYKELFSEEKQEIATTTKNKKFSLLTEIEQSWEEIINDIEWLIDDWFYILRLLFKEFYEGFFWEDIKTIDLRWMDLLNNREFMNSLQELSGEIWCNPEDLIFVMYCESKLDPTAVNKYSNASWLLQWLPSTAKWLWTTTQKLLQLPAKDQLIYVYKFLDQNDRWKTLDTPQKLYASVFYPKYLEHINDPSYILWSHVSERNALKIAKNNPAITRYSNRKINGQKVIDWYAFNRYVESQKREFDRKILLS